MTTQTADTGLLTVLKETKGGSYFVSNYPPYSFWNADQVPGVGDVVPPLLAYADLTGTTDGRNLEAAKMIYERLLEPALRNQA